MAFAVVASLGEGTAINGGTTSSINTTGANLIVACVHWYGGASPGDTMAGNFSDSKSNTWTKLNVADSGASLYQRCTFFYCAAPTVGSGHTFTVSTAYASYPTITVIAFSGAAASPYDSNQSTNGATSATSIQPGSVTPSEDNCVLVSGGTINTANTKAINSSFTKLHDVAPSSGVYVAGTIAYKIQTTAGAENPMWSWTGAQDCAANIAVWKAAAAAGGKPWNYYAQLG